MARGRSHLRRRDVQAQRARLLRDGERDTLAAQQRPHLAHDLAHPASGRRRARRAGPRPAAACWRQPEDESRRRARRAWPRHARWPRCDSTRRDGRADAGCARSSPPPPRDDRDVVRPRLRQQQRVVAQALAERGERQELLAAVLQRHHRDGDGRATAAMLRHPASAGRIFLATRSSSSIIRLGSSRRNTTAVWLTPDARIPRAGPRRLRAVGETFSLSSKRIEISIVFTRAAASASARSSASEARSSSGSSTSRASRRRARPRGAGPPSCAADPDRRVRLLHRLGLEADVANAIELALEAGLALGPRVLNTASASSAARPRLASRRPGSPAPAATKPRPRRR